MRIFDFRFENVGLSDSAWNGLHNTAKKLTNDYTTNNYLAKKGWR
jgi:hypothetical protein